MRRDQGSGRRDQGEGIRDQERGSGLLSASWGRSGFTILELLVASLLLSMLVTMLTMIFNQSSIAWNTGVASVNDLETVRTKLGGYHNVFDEALPGVGQDNVNVSGNSDNRQIKYRTVSLFRNWNGSGQLNGQQASANCQGRSFDKIDWSNLESYESRMQDVARGASSGSLGSGTRWNKGNGGFIVGVRSWGPDRQEGTDDDITTYPEDVN